MIERTSHISNKFILNRNLLIKWHNLIAIAQREIRIYKVITEGSNGQYEFIKSFTYNPDLKVFSFMVEHASEQNVRDIVSKFIVKKTLNASGSVITNLGEFLFEYNEE